jgi:hypothetical protein
LLVLSVVRVCEAVLEEVRGGRDLLYRYLGIGSEVVLHLSVEHSLSVYRSPATKEAAACPHLLLS